MFLRFRRVFIRHFGTFKPSLFVRPVIKHSEVADGDALIGKFCAPVAPAEVIAAAEQDGSEGPGYQVEFYSA